MPKKSYVSVPLLMLCLSGCVHSPVGEMKFPEGTVQHVVHANQIEWKPGPTNLPPGCEVAVLEGSPKSADLFTARFRLEKGFYVPPHTHPKDERVTVLDGKVSVAFGENASHEDARQFGPGDYYVNSRGAVHSVWIDEASVIQVTGIGPWELNFVGNTCSAATHE